jgi:hypothetical protein
LHEFQLGHENYNDVYSSVLLTVNLDCERLVGLRWHTIVRYAAVDAHVLAVYLGDVESVAGGGNSCKRRKNVDPHRFSFAAKLLQKPSCRLGF